MSADLDLSRRAIAAGWRWQRGCQSADGLMVYETFTDGTPSKWGDSSRYIQGRDPDWCCQRWSTKLPDFNNDPTRGVLLAQVRERWGNPRIYVACVMSMETIDWWQVRVDGRTVCTGPTETAALICALEAAPERK